MKQRIADSRMEIYLLPGELHFAGAETRIHTVLGSCVSIALWHPHTRNGGMCHFMLPSRGKPPQGNLDGRYADEAMTLMLRELNASGAHPSACQVKLFGGGNMFGGERGESSFDVARANIEAARVLLSQAGFAINGEDVGGFGHRRIIFDLADGHVWVRHEKLPLARAGKQ